jgi:hypothetical protein
VPQPIRQATLIAIDERIYRTFRFALDERHDTERVIIAITKAQNWWAAASLAALLADRDRRSAWARADAALAGAWVAAKLTSRSVRRPRPNLADCQPARHNSDRESFPSSHATIAFAAVVALPPPAAANAADPLRDHDSERPASPRRALPLRRRRRRNPRDCGGQHRPRRAAPHKLGVAVSATTTGRTRGLACHAARGCGHLRITTTSQSQRTE